jgi:hypothetical protein
VDDQAGRVQSIDMEKFVESMTRAVFKGMLAAGLNPQLPPPGETPDQDRAAPLNPQPLPPFDVTVGLIISSGEDVSVLRVSKA